MKQNLWFLGAVVIIAPQGRVEVTIKVVNAIKFATEVYRQRGIAKAAARFVPLYEEYEPVIVFVPNGANPHLASPQIYAEWGKFGCRAAAEVAEEIECVDISDYKGLGEVLGIPWEYDKDEFYKLFSKKLGKWKDQ